MKKSKFLSILLALCLTLSLLPTAALAEDAAAIDLDTFITWLKDSNYTVDGESYTGNTNAVQDGKLIVKWSPVSGCLGNNCSQTHEGIEHGSVTTNRNVPNKVNSDLAQFYIANNGEQATGVAVSISNVKFVYEPASFQLYGNTGYAGSWTADGVRSGQLYFMTSGDVTFEGCEFDKVVLTMFNTTGTSTVKDCSFKNVYNNYAIKDIRGANVSVTGTTIENCGGGIMVSQTANTNVTAVTLTGNTFKDVDVAGTAPSEKVGTRAILQVAKTGDYTGTNFDLSGNSAAGCGPVLRQLNEKATAGIADQADALQTIASGSSTLYTTDSKRPYAAETKDGTTYNTLAEALTAVSAANPLTWVSDTAWPAATPVYYNGNPYATIGELLYDAQQKSGVISSPNIETAVIYCRPNTLIPAGTASHPSFVTSTTIFGNGATLSGATEWDVENYYTLTKNISINIYDLNGGASVWGTRRSDYTVTVNMENCKDAHEVLFNYGSGNGKVDITVKNCTFLKNGGASHGWPISINCLGSLLVDGCTFDGVTTGVVVNVKQPSENGTMDVAVKNSTFNNVTGQDGNKGALRVTGQQACSITLTIDEVEFTGTHADPSDITIGNVKAADNLGIVSYTITNTSGTMDVHKQDETATKVTTTLDGTSTLPYTGSNVPVAPAFNTTDKTITNVTTDNLQDILDGKYGSIDGMTIILPTGNYGQLELGRATKYETSNTKYFILEGNKFDQQKEYSYEDFCRIKNDTSTWSGVPLYIRSMSNVTLKAADGATVNVAGIFASSGHKYENAYDYVLDRDVANGNSYYLVFDFANINFEGLTFTAKSDINTSLEQSVINGVAFRNCTFDIGSTVSGNQAIRYYNENDNGNVRNLVVDHCKFYNCFQGVYTNHIKNITVTNNEFDTTGHNAIAIQDFKGACDHGSVIITNNIFKNIGDRIIRFGEVANGTKITIVGNTATNSGDSNGEVIKATGIAEGVITTIYDNSWGFGTKVANDQLKDIPVSSAGGTDWSGSYVSVPSTPNGTVTVSPKNAAKGTTVTINVTPDAGYELGSLTVTDSKGDELALSGSGSSFTFTMPAGSVVVKATFVKRTVSFSDVSANDYFAGAVTWAVEKGITDGIGNGLFGPNQPCTRGQIVTFLWRAAGSPEPKALSSFTDVPANEYYAKAVAWAVENGITTGTSATTFSPNDTCTRGQAVTFLCRAVGAQGAYDGAFSDVTGEMYCAGSVAWAVANGVTTGVGGGKFAPDDFCTRGQIVTFLYRAYQGK